VFDLYTLIIVGNKVKATLLQQKIKGKCATFLIGTKAKFLKKKAYFLMFPSCANIQIGTL
tara:strand:+ start:380 stop:559 length:180 start_codon:yes stop_codon:yes gene_type:complete